MVSFLGLTVVDELIVYGFLAGPVVALILVLLVLITIFLLVELDVAFYALFIAPLLFVVLGDLAAVMSDFLEAEKETT